MRNLRRLVVGGLLLAGAILVVLRARRQPSPFPASQRLFLSLPRPFLNRERLRRMLAPQPGERILELGPGAGYYTIETASSVLPGGRLDALDLQPAMLDLLMQHAAAEDLRNVHPVSGDAQALPYPDGSFDAVYLVAVLGEVPDRRQVLREIRRVLKRGGRLVVGEGQPDPHMVTQAKLEAMAREADLLYDRHEGGALGYVARFDAA